MVALSLAMLCCVISAAHAGLARTESTLMRRPSHPLRGQAIN
jgi:hypothetical protein